MILGPLDDIHSPPDKLEMLFSYGAKVSVVWQSCSSYNSLYIIRQSTIYRLWVLKIVTVFKHYSNPFINNNKPIYR